MRRKTCTRYDCMLISLCALHTENQPDEEVVSWQSDHVGENCNHFQPLDESHVPAKS